MPTSLAIHVALLVANWGGTFFRSEPFLALHNNDPFKVIGTDARGIESGNAKRISDWIARDMLAVWGDVPPSTYDGRAFDTFARGLSRS